MKQLILIVASLSLALGCGHKNSDPVGTVRALKERACACKDASCIDKVSGEFQSWQADLKAKGASKSDFSEEDRAKIRDLAREMAECGHKLVP